MKRGTPPMTHYFWAYGTVVEAALTDWDPQLARFPSL